MNCITLRGNWLNKKQIYYIKTKFIAFRLSLSQKEGNLTCLPHKKTNLIIEKKILHTESDPDFILLMIIINLH